MCRFLCVATKGIVPHQAMSGFKRLARRGRNPPGTGKGHRGGWGVGYYPGGRLRLVKEFGDPTCSVRYDEVSHMAASNPDARVLLGHLWSSPAKQLSEHKEMIAPFQGFDAAGHEWIFVSDSSIGVKRITGEPYVVDPVKETCPQRLFRELSARMLPAPGGGPASRDAVISALKMVLDHTAQEYEFGHLNLAMSNGTTVYMARYVDKEADWNEAHFCRLPRSIVGCSEPLETIDGKWEPLADRQVIIFDNGLNMSKAKL